MPATATTTTRRLLGELSVEGQIYSAPDGSGSGDRMMYRPHGTYLQNDGVWHYWIERDRTYCLAHDGRGWVVTCTSWPPSPHTYRLAADGVHVAWLPLAEHGLVVLNPARRYTIRQGDGWELHEL